jgi:hypothetical protein
MLVGLLIFLSPLAQASPPDPTWIAGWWDDADYDDVVTLVLGTATAVTLAPLVDCCPEPLVRPLQAVTHVTPRALVPATQLYIRPPPTL